MRRRIFIASVLIVTSLCSMAGACPMCRDSNIIPISGGGNQPAALFNSSILAILAAFVIALTVLVTKMVAAIRRVNRQHPIY